MPIPARARPTPMQTAARIARKAAAAPIAWATRA
jgi:hypothetical protein